MPQLPTFRKGQVDDGLKKSTSAQYDLLTASQPQPPLIPIPRQFRTNNMRTSKSDVLLSTMHSSNSCCQFGSSQKFGSRLHITPTVRASSRANVAPGPSGVSTTITTTNTFRKNPSSFLSRVHALTMQRCPRLSNSKSFLTIGSAIPKSSSRCSMAPSMRSNASTASFRPNCRLCLCDIPFREFYELEGCGCTFCRECVEQYIKIQILDGNIKILCPDGQCPKKGVMTGSEIEQLSDNDLYSKYKRFKLNTEVDLDQNRTWCPKPGCETICEVVSSMGSNKWQATAFKCPTCIQTYCSACKVEWQTEHTCTIYTKKKKPTWFLGSDDGIIFSEGEEAPIKHCPVCRVPIERDSGCAQMMCKKCKHVFCWYCLASLDDDFLLRHYDKGPCKNKLGHSRASVIWHRAQVIGIFAGFGLLILVASPLLLLAAPCILCCRCKGCDRCHDTNSPDVPVNL